MDISISADGFRLTARHVHQCAREIHDRVSLRDIARISGLCAPRCREFRLSRDLRRELETLRIVCYRYHYRVVSVG